MKIQIVPIQYPNHVEPFECEGHTPEEDLEPRLEIFVDEGPEVSYIAISPLQGRLLRDWLTKVSAVVDK